MLQRLRYAPWVPVLFNIQAMIQLNSIRGQQIVSMGIDQPPSLPLVSKPGHFGPCQPS